MGLLRKDLNVLWLCTLAIAFTTVAWANDRTEYLVRVAKVYSKLRKIDGPPGTYEPTIENLYFALFMLDLDVQPPGGDITMTEWGHVLQRLQAEGFKFDLQKPPFAGQDFKNLLDARNGGNGTVRRGLRAFYAQSLVDVHRSYPVPFTELKVRPSILDAYLPPFLSAVKAGDGGTTPVVLNQRMGQLGRLTATLELFAQTAVGRDLLVELLPLLKSGGVRVEPITDDVRRRHRSNLADGHQAAALYVPSIYWDDTKGRYETRAVIYVDAGAELGNLAEDLFHEARHATDPQFRQRTISANTLLQRATELRRQGKLTAAGHLEQQAQELLETANTETERYAYDGQAQFKKELGEAFPEAKQYYYAKIQRRESAPLVTTPEFLNAAYGIAVPGCPARLAALSPSQRPSWRGPP